VPTEVSNRLLACLTPACRQDLKSLLRKVDLPVNTVFYEAEQEITEAYFINSGFASQVIQLGDAGSAEVGVVGLEGLVGSTALLGRRAIAPGRCFMQASGAGYVIPLEALRQVFASSEETRSRVLEFVQHQMLTGTYLSACNNLHEAEPRFARWILMVQDRLETDVLPLTQEFLAQMLGSRRMTVTTVAGALQHSGLIEYRRGQIRILDRSSLEDAACECYGSLKKLYGQLYSS
jgi:CRP-like cAMP-binding protein